MSARLWPMSEREGTADTASRDMGLGAGERCPIAVRWVFGGLSRENLRELAGTFRCLRARMGNRTRIPRGRS